jgi:hypothetical protein
LQIVCHIEPFSSTTVRSTVRRLVALSGTPDADFSVALDVEFDNRQIAARTSNRDSGALGIAAALVARTTELLLAKTPAFHAF